ncbi:MAG: hypothetical protein IPL53_04165 [Ignavibacteria bacterium]|nr:hypothetical protein [Ignavibacteria bacterium]
MLSDKQTKVLFTWDADPELKKHFKKAFYKIKNVKIVFPENVKEKNILKLSKDADAIVGWRPSIELLRSAERLKLYINPGTGIKHHINNFREINKAREITLVNGHGHAYATAQHAVSMLLALMNRIIRHHTMMREGVWRMSDDKDITSSTVQLRNKKIGLLGYGAINKYVHQFLSGFENEFHVLKRDLGFGISDLELFKRKVFLYSTKDLSKFLKAIDILIIAIPHTSKTEGMLGKRELKLLGKGSLLVNVARGLIVDEESLYDALKNNVIGGAALDVWYNYSPKKDKKGRSYPFRFPFHKLKNVLMSPHRAASPFDELSRWDEVIENIKRVSNGRKDYLNIVDLNEEY